MASCIMMIFGQQMVLCQIYELGLTNVCGGAQASTARQQTIQTHCQITISLTAL